MAKLAGQLSPFATESAAFNVAATKSLVLGTGLSKGKSLQKALALASFLTTADVRKERKKMETTQNPKEQTAAVGKVFYIPTHWSEKHQSQIAPSVIDQAVERNGVTVGMYSNETLEMMRGRYPTVELGELDKIVEEKENMLRTDPAPCTEEQFWEALECLPPLDWQRTGAIGESFKLEERTCGRMTSIYARVGETYWTFTDVDTLPHGEIMAKVQAASKTPA